MNDYGLLEGLKRLNRAVKARGLGQISDMNASHRELCERAADLFASIRDEAAIDPDHGNGTGAIIKQNVSTIRGYLSTLEQLADRITSVEGDRQDAYDETPARAWYQRGGRSMSRKYNQNHDPENGQFTTGDGAGSGGGMSDNDRRAIEQAERDVDAAIATGSLRTMERVLRTFDYSHDGADTRDGQDRFDRHVNRLLDAIARHPDKNKSVPGAHAFYKG